MRKTSLSSQMKNWSSRKKKNYVYPELPSPLVPALSIFAAASGTVV